MRKIGIATGLDEPTLRTVGGEVIADQKVDDITYLKHVAEHAVLGMHGAGMPSIGQALSVIAEMIHGAALAGLGQDVNVGILNENVQVGIAELLILFGVATGDDRVARLGPIYKQLLEATFTQSAMAMARPSSFGTTRVPEGAPHLIRDGMREREWDRPSPFAVAERVNVDHFESVVPDDVSRQASRDGLRGGLFFDGPGVPDECDVIKRPDGCKCHQEIGDSCCPVHPCGEGEDGGCCASSRSEDEADAAPSAGITAVLVAEMAAGRCKPVC